MLRKPEGSEAQERCRGALMRDISAFPKLPDSVEMIRGRRTTFTCCLFGSGSSHNNSAPQATQNQADPAFADVSRITIARRGWATTAHRKTGRSSECELRAISLINLLISNWPKD